MTYAFPVSSSPARLIRLRLAGRPKHDLTTWTVTDDWPDPVPVTEAEIEVFERWFGDLFDELFGPDTGPPIPGPRSTLKTVLKNDTEYSMKKRHRATLELIFARPVNGSIRWAHIEALFVALGAEVSEREGSRVGVFLFGEVRVFHRPHPSPDTDKGAVASIRKWLDGHGVKP